MFVTVRQKLGYDCAKLVLLPFAEDRTAAFGSLATEARDQGRYVREEERHESEQQDCQRERRGHEARRAPLAYGERPPELRLHQGAEDYAEYHRPHREVVPAHKEAQDTYGVHDQEVYSAVGDAIDAQSGENQNAGIEEGPGNLQHLHPDPDQWKVQDQQHDVADVEAGDQGPDEIRGVLEEQGPWLQIEDLERGEQDRRGRRSRYTECQERYQHPRERRVVGGLRPGHALYRPVAKLVLVTG